MHHLFGLSAAFRILNAQSCKCSVYGYGDAPPRSARLTFARTVVPNHHESCTFRSQDGTFTQRHRKQTLGILPTLRTSVPGQQWVEAEILLADLTSRAESQTAGAAN